MLKQARSSSLAFWQGFREHRSGASEGTRTPARSENEDPARAARTMSIFLALLLSDRNNPTIDAMAQGATEAKVCPHRRPP